jgi:SAM-dependent methyltransferase
LIKDIFRWLFFNIKYLGDPPWDTGITPPELEAFIAAHPPGRVLDLGCGTGTNITTLGEAGWKVVGVEYVWKAVRAARRRLREAGLAGKVLMGDVTRLERLDGRFDLILDIGCYHSLSDEKRQVYRRNLRSRLATGGTFLIYAHLEGENSQSSNRLDAAAVAALSSTLDLVHHQDSFDNAERPATWMTFRNNDQVQD